MNMLQRRKKYERIIFLASQFFDNVLNSLFNNYPIEYSNFGGFEWGLLFKKSSLLTVMASKKLIILTATSHCSF